MTHIETIAQAMLDKKAQKVISLDLKSVGSNITDFFVICNADSHNQVTAIADNIEKEMYEQHNIKVGRQQGRENSFWIILDYFDIVVHIFQTEYRDFYRLEELWADAELTEYNDEN